MLCRSSHKACLAAHALKACMLTSAQVHEQGVFVHDTYTQTEAHLC